MSTYLFDKKVDKSIFNDGMAIPKTINNILRKEFSSNFLKGESLPVQIRINNKNFTAHLKRINNKDSNRDTLQIRYSKNSKIANELKEIFSYTFSGIENNLSSESKVSETIKVYLSPTNIIEFFCYPVDYNDITLFDTLTKLTEEYLPAKKEKHKKHPLDLFIRKRFPLFQNHELLRNNNLKIYSSTGRGNWADIPWIRIYNDKISPTPKEGVYITYLLSKDGNSVFLTLMQGVENLKESEKFTFEEAIKILTDNSLQIQDKLNSKNFSKDKINLKSSRSDTIRLYEAGTIFSKEYRKGSIPSNDDLMEDLNNMIDIYNEYINQFYKAQENQVFNDISEEIEKPNELMLSIKQIIQIINHYIDNKGFTYEKDLIENFYLSLKSKPFVILAGISGTGKTRLVRLFAESLGATSSEGNFKLVPVRPDWSDSSDLFGHVNLNGNFIPGEILEFITKAQKDPNRPYFLCLDEMNLARVEYYLSDLLSILETREIQGDKIISDPLITESYYGEDRTAFEKYGELILPDNLYIIGTVNMDETTFPFSKKVLDRANTIEFSEVDLLTDLGRNIPEVDPIKVSNDFLKSEYLFLKDCINEEDLVSQVNTELTQINNILKKANLHIGYRIRDEIAFYIVNNKVSDLLSFEEAFDNELKQKILPRIQGSSLAVLSVLYELFQYCSLQEKAFELEDNNVSSKMERVLNSVSSRFPKSAKKIAYMVRKFEEDGFTSFWI